jgi:PAS domain S-box-containing protein
MKHIGDTRTTMSATGPTVPQSQQYDPAAHLEIALFRTDADGRWSALSDAWTRITGFETDACLGLPARQFVHAADQSRLAAFAQHMLQAPGQYFRQTLRICKANGATGWIEAYAATWPDAQGARLSVSGYIADATPAPLPHARRYAMRVVQDEQPAVIDRLGSTGAPIAFPEQAPLTLLLVEDQLVTQKLVRLILEKWGHHVYVASDGRAALESYLQRRFDLVLMDLQLPLMDGLSVTAAIREYEAQAGLARTPVIALTAQTEPEDRAICFAAGMDGYLSKPVMTQSLRETLQAHGAHPTQHPS